MMNIFIIVAIAILGVIIGYGTVRVISITRSIRSLEFEYYWKTKGHKFVADLNEVARLSGAVGFSMYKFAKLLGSLNRDPWLIRMVPKTREHK